MPMCTSRADVDDVRRQPEPVLLIQLDERDDVRVSEPSHG